MNALEQFQQDHGAQWNQIIDSPAFGAAMLYLNTQKITSITQLSDDDIEARGKLVLADLRGHLNHENDLMRLHVMKSLEWNAAIPETYPSAEEEAAEAERHNTKPPEAAPAPKPSRRKKK